jgi:Fe-S-cluster containining protein
MIADRMTMARTIRLAVIGASPCGRCVARCCKQHGPEYAVLLRGDEPRRFAPWAVAISVTTGERQVVSEHVLPYVDGRCQFLGEDDRCRIYEDRPLSCREFECVHFYNAEGVGRHGTFLYRNPDVIPLIESM